MSAASLIDCGGLPAQQSPPATERNSDPKPCTHGERHEHGTRSRYRFDECRCPPCTRANSHYQDQRNRLIAADAWAPLVEAGPAASHLQRLLQAGMQAKEIGQGAAVPVSTVYRLLGGGMPRRVRAETAERLLAVPHPGIDATGTRRRLQALVAIGWPPAALDEQCGEESGWVELLLGRELVSETTAGRVVSLFERLWDCPPPQQTPEQQHAAEQARARAKRNGWGPPMAWDEDLNPIDDPAAQPDLGERVRFRKLPPAEELQYLLDAGDSKEMIATRFGVKTTAVKRALQRGRADTPAPSEPAAPDADAAAEQETAA